MKYTAKILTAVLIGILIAFLSAGQSILFLLLLLLFLSLGAWSVVYRRHYSEQILLVVFLLIASLLTAIQRENYFHMLRQNKLFDGKDVQLSGEVVQRLRAVGDGSNCFFILDVSRGKNRPFGKITVYSGEAVEGIEKGVKVTIAGRFKQQQMPNLRGFPEYAERQKLSGILYLNSANDFLDITAKMNFVYGIEQFRNRLMNFGRNHLTYIASSLLHGMIYNEDLPENKEFAILEKVFQRTGTVHLLTVSGLHVGFLALAFGKILGFFRLSRTVRLLTVIVLIWLYAFMSGGETAVLRATIMLSACLLAQLSDARSTALNNLSLAGLILLLLNPCNLFEVGCQLSFAATLGCVWLFVKIKEILPLRKSFWRTLAEIFLLSISVQIMLLPLISCYFREISLCSPIVNIFLLLPAELAVIFGIFGELCGLFCQPLGWLLLQIANLNLFLIKEIACYFATWSWAGMSLPLWSWLWLLAYYPLLVLLTGNLQPNIITGKVEISKFAMVITFLIVLNLIGFGGWHITRSSNFVEVLFLPSGRCGATLLKFPGNLRILCGGGSEGSGSVQVLRGLAKQKIEYLSAAVVLNAEPSDLYGMLKIIEELKVKTVYLPAGLSKNEALETFYLRCEQLGTICIDVGMNEVICFGTANQAKILTGFDSAQAAFFMNCGENKLFITGKLNEKSERILVKKFPEYIRKAVIRVEKAAFTQRFTAHSQPAQVFFGVSTGKTNLKATAACRLTSMGIKVRNIADAETIIARLYP